MGSTGIMASIMLYCTDPMTSYIHSPLSFKKLRDDKIEEFTKTIQDDAPYQEDKDERLILCKYCFNKITSLNAVIERNGKHQHTFYNPEGIIYQIGCFSSAAGCVVFGHSTSAFTWFPGFSWRYAACANCRVQLGWYYQSRSEGNFYGLILNKLIEG